MSNKGGLGKGLGALFGDAAAESGSDAVVTELPLNQVIPNPNQPRTDFNDKGIEELAASINKEGLLQPIIVRPDGDKYQIIAGERRWQACRSLKLETVPVRVMPVDETKTLELALIENLQRTNLNPIEEARGYKTLINASGMSQSELAAAVSKDRSTVNNAMRLLDLPEEVQELLYEGKIKAGHARAILTVPEEEKRIRLGKKIADDQLSVREAENMARLYSAGVAPGAKRMPTPGSYKKVARQLRKQLGASVSVKNSRGKNRIEIFFEDENDLQRIMNIISGSADSTATEAE